LYNSSNSSNILVPDYNFFFWPNFRLLTKTSILEQKKLRFVAKILTFDSNLHFWTHFVFRLNILVFDQKFDFWPNFRFGKTSIFVSGLIFLTFDQNFDFRLKFQFFVYKKNWPKVRFLTKIWTQIVYQKFNRIWIFIEIQITCKFTIEQQKCLFSKKWCFKCGALSIIIYHRSFLNVPFFTFWFGFWEIRRKKYLFCEI